MPSRIRVFAVCCGLLALLLNLGEKLWVQPWSWRFEPWVVALIVHLVAAAAALLVPLAIFGLLAWRTRARSANLAVDNIRRRFVASGLPYVNGMWAVLLMWLAGGFVMTERVPHQEAMRLAELPGALVVSAVTVVVFVAAGVAVLFYDTARVVMDPDGLHVRQLWKSSRVRWDDLASVEQVRMGLWVYRRTSRTRVGVPLSFLQVDPDALTAAIHTYLQQPERRAAIGTLEELERLLPPEPITEASQRS